MYKVREVQQIMKKLSDISFIWRVNVCAFHISYALNTWNNKVLAFLSPPQSVQTWTQQDSILSVFTM